MTPLSDMRYDPDVYSGAVCHPEAGMHEHRAGGTAEPWTGMVVCVPLNSAPVVVRWSGDTPTRVGR